MTIKAWIAVGMILLCCAWSAWLFGGVDWATAQKERGLLEYSPDTSVVTLSTSAESVEKTTRTFLEDAGRINAAPERRIETYASRRSRDLFSGRRSSRATLSDDELDVIYVDAPKIEEKPKPAFPVERYKVTGVMLGPDPRVFVQDSADNKTRSYRIGDRIDNGTVQAISEEGATIVGDFGRLMLGRQVR